MEIVLCIYFGINLMLLGSYISSYDGEILSVKIFCCFLLVFFGGILVIYELTIADKVVMWWHNSEIGFWYKLNINKYYDNKSDDYIESLKKFISVEKENKDKESQKLVRHLNRILKRNSK